MKYGFVFPNSDVDSCVEVGPEIEAAGWDAMYVADGVYGPDPWVSLAAVAMVTQRIQLGPLLTPPSRRRPWKLASEVASLDRLSNGRAVLPVGLGATDTGFDRVGEAIDRKTRAELLDETLELLTLFWSGQPFKFKGKHYNVDWGSGWSYTPRQQPRVPIWNVAVWKRPASLRRALRYDGILPVKMHDDGSFAWMTADDVRELRTYIAEHRDPATPFDIAIEGVTPGDDHDKAAAIIEPLRDAGMTWWIESMWDSPGGMKAVRERIRQGPPKIQ
jgi:alkanesulfonate monooxygenase SsuD/methylene tetrahydromethanopterin reductase-like flavin-dependent oxidoreductase (luciferase family)